MERKELLNCGSIQEHKPMKTRNSEAGATEDSIKMIIRSEEDRRQAKETLDALQLPAYLSITPPRASDELTARMHCAVRCIAQQLMWAGEKLSEDDWKRLLVAAHFGQRVLPAPGGKGFIVLDRKTSRMSGPQKYDLVESMYAFGAERGVIFTEPEEVK